MKNLLFGTLLLGLAWNFGPALTDLLSALVPLFGALLYFFTPEKPFDRDTGFYVQFALGLVLFWAFLKVGGIAFGFLMPNAQRFSSTKLLRRLQGLSAEFILFGGVLCLLMLLLLVTDTGRGVIVRAMIADAGGAMATQADVEAQKAVVREMVFEDRFLFSESGGRRAAVGVLFKSLWTELLLCSFVLYLLLQWLIKQTVTSVYGGVFRFLEAGRFGFGGSGRFAGLVEEWALRFQTTDGGLFMGRSLYNPFLHVGLRDDRHMLTIAGSRAGKGTTAIIPNLLLWKGSALVIDPKGTNAAVTAAERRRMGHNVYLVDPFGLVKSEGTDSFNPLAILDPDSPTIREEIGAITEALVVAEPNQKDKHWDEGARTILGGLIGHLISHPDYEGRRTLPTLREMLTLLPDEQLELWTDMSLNEGAGKIAKEAAGRVIRGIDTNEILGLLSNADKHTEWLASGAIQQALTESSFSFGELKQRPTTVYLILPPHFLETHKRFLRLFINLAILQMSIGGRSKVPVLMVMDEFLALGHMSEVEKAFGLMAGYNLVLWPFVQDFGRLKQLYGDSVNAFITNSRAVQVFGVSDGETTKFVSDQIGERSLRMMAIGQDSMRAVPVRTPVEVAKDIAADSGRQYILRAGKAPLVLEKVSYHRERGDIGNELPDPIKRALMLFAGRYDSDPDYA